MTEGETIIDTSNWPSVTVLLIVLLNALLEIKAGDKQVSYIRCHIHPSYLA